MSSGKTLLITGASSDVGLKLLDKIAGNYDRIWAHYCHSKEAIDMLGQSGGTVPVQADFSKWVGILELKRYFLRLSFFIGGGRSGNRTEYRRHRRDSIMGLNTRMQRQ